MKGDPLRSPDDKGGIRRGWTIVFVALENWLLAGTPVATVPFGFMAWIVSGIEKKSMMVWSTSTP
jgi:hypothetical protein